MKLLCSPMFPNAVIRPTTYYETINLALQEAYRTTRRQTNSRSVKSRTA